jgi:hypothetical protein
MEYTERRLHGASVHGWRSLRRPGAVDGGAQHLLLALRRAVGSEAAPRR